MTLGATVALKFLKASRSGPGEALSGKVVVVTGASRGIGRAVALECAQRGARVVLAARHKETLQGVADEVRQLGGEATVAVTDVTDPAQVQRLVNTAVATYGRLDVMMNHAGTWFIDTVEHSDPQRTRNLIELNVMGVLHGVQAALPVMRLQGFGHIINTSSIEGRVGFPFTGVYAGTKAFVELLTQALRQELMYVERTGIRVSVLLPVTTRTPIFDHVDNVKEGGQGAHMVRPVQEATQVARAVVDAMEHYRPVIYPLAPSKGLVMLYDLLPKLTGQLMTLARVDRHVSPLSHRQRGSHREERPILPVVKGGTRHD
ncbi:SDR family NAD(P)-dependent oxidoreductase [Deinococcus humi]|uniref:NADP-dependent 3-hydroxy acid dehydrogenase YdfG n=1 Tax=Deinococcus humi TaxID=662880 RepID=A0A7W8JV79_9DEIO|nr:SDR family oxidoreductase [Deinococcus humi]MBB5363877.1 NADP-dependent 3-hydroxy acid dehydrogenase YdfG [Deinococcus humi]